MATATATARDWQGPALAVVGAVAFSAKAIIVKLAYRYEVDPVTLIMLRMLVAFPFFVAMAWWAGRGRARLAPAELLAVTGLGFSGYYLASTLDFWGLQYISASLERLILYLSPATVLLLSWWLFKRPATRTQLWSLALGYGGIVLVFGHELRLEGAQVWLGASLVLASTLSYAIYMLYSGEWVQRIGAARLTGWATAVACVLCMLQYLALRPLATVMAVPEPVWWLSLLNGTLCTVVPVLMVMMAIQRIGPARSAQLGMAGPISTVVLGVLLLDEPLTLWLLAGTLCVLASVTLLASRR